MFIGRNEELTILSQSLLDSGHAVMIYGKRKIGKTTLIRQYLKSLDHPVIYFECLKGSLDENLKALTNEAVTSGVLPGAVQFESFMDFFSFIDSSTQRCTVVIDEYPYLKIADNSPLVDSIFQNIIDNRIHHINLILSGSHIGMMKDLLEEGNSLYGRFRSVICLRELNYLDASCFYPDLSPYEKIAFYSVFGGSPFVNELLDPKKTLRENICSTILDERNAVYLYADNLLLSDYSNRVSAEKICRVLRNGKKYYREIESALKMEKNGNLNKQLKVLINMDLIIRSNPINRLEDSRKSSYEINDNLLRFFFTFADRNKSALAMLGPYKFFDTYIDPELTTFISHRFEGQCRSFFSIRAGKGNFTGIRNIGSFYYDDSRNKKNGEFDIAIEYENGYEIYEAKYWKSKLPMSEITKEISQVKEIPGLPVKKIGFISANGFERVPEDCTCFTAEDLYDTTALQAAP